jgi:uncharacterized membrane-anchored protein
MPTAIENKYKKSKEFIDSSDKKLKEINPTEKEELKNILKDLVLRMIDQNDKSKYN